MNQTASSLQSSANAITPALAVTGTDLRKHVGRPRDHPDRPHLRIEITRHPSVCAVRLAQLPSKYGATYFRDALARFVVSVNHPDLSPAEVEKESASIFFPFNTVSAFHKIKFWVQDPHGLSLPGSEIRDVIHVTPARKNKHGAVIPGRFDTALVRTPVNNTARAHAAECSRMWCICLGIMYHD